MKKPKLTPTTNHFKRWTSKEDSELKDAIEAGYDVRETATLLGRTVASIHTRKSQLFAESGDTRRFPITERKESETHRLYKLHEFDEEQQKLIRRELLLNLRVDLATKWSLDLRTIRQFPDMFSDNTLRAQHAIQLFDTRDAAANHLGWSTRTLYRRLEEGGSVVINHEEKILDSVSKRDAPLELNSSALLVRDVVIALKPYGVSCSFEFDGDQVKTLTATFS